MAVRKRFARGNLAWGHDARTGERVLLRDLVRDGDTGLPVTRRSYEPKHPQEIPPDIYDPQSLRRPAPDLDREGYTVSWPTGNWERLWEFYSNPRLAFHVAKAPYIATDIANAIAASADDANEVVSTGAVVISGTTIGFQDDRFGGFRFQALGIDQGAEIHRAWIQFTSSFSSTNPDTNGAACTVQIWGQDADDAAAFTTGATDITGRTKTAETVLWSFSSASDAPTIWHASARGPNQRTPDLSAIIQEIVDRAGWASGNDMAFLFQQITGGTGVRQVAAWDHATLSPAMLFVEHGTNEGSGSGMDSGFDSGFG